MDLIFRLFQFYNIKKKMDKEKYKIKFNYNLNSLNTFKINQKKPEYQKIPVHNFNYKNNDFPIIKQNKNPDFSILGVLMGFGLIGLFYQNINKRLQ